MMLLMGALMSGDDPYGSEKKDEPCAMGVGYERDPNTHQRVRHF
jgi:hypothetical protein